MSNGKTKHKYHTILKAIAEGDEIQYLLHPSSSWKPLSAKSFLQDMANGDSGSPEFYRAKPKTIKIGDVEVIAPITKVPKNGQLLLYAATLAESGYSSFPWDGMEVDVDAYYFSNNLLFDNKEDAKSFSFALRKLIQKAVDTSRSH